MFSKLGLALVQTGKEEYDSSVKAEKEATYTTESVFQELRADLEGFVASLSLNDTIDPSIRTGSTRMFIVSINRFTVLWRFTLVGPRDGANHWHRRAYGHAIHPNSRTRID
jgi:hypothetical protein